MNKLVKIFLKFNFKRGKFCHLAEIRAHYARRFYVVEFLENGAEETIYPEDITTFDYRKRIPNIDENFQIWHFETQTRLSVKLKSMFLLKNKFKTFLICNLIIFEKL